MGGTDGERFRFGTFEIDLRAGELRREGDRIRLQDLPFRLLVSLVERPGELVTREELRSAIWPTGTFVDFERGLGTAMNKVREALRDSAANPRFIETVPRRGYRFVAPVERITTGAGDGIADTPQARPSPAVPPSNARLRFGWAGVLAAGAIILIALAALSWVAWRHASSGVDSRAAIRSLAVLPLDNLSGDPAQDYFADGVTEELTTELAKVGALRVVSNTSAKQFKHTGKTLPEIARALGVDAVVEGALLRSGNRFKVTAQLVRAPTDESVWAQTYDGDLGDMTAFEDDVVRVIAAQVRIELSAPDRQRLVNARRVLPEVHDAYLRGRDQWNRRTPASLSRALELFHEAIQKDPSYAPAYAGLADTYAILGAAGYDVMPESEAMQMARAAALKAIELDDRLSDAHTSLAFVAYSFDWNWEQAEREFQRALDLNPSSATAHQWYSEYLTDFGRWQQAISETERAVAVDPMSPIIHENLGRPYYYSHHWEKAIEYSMKALEIDPDFSISHLRLGRAYAAEGKYAEAAGEFQRYLSLSNGNTLAIASLANIRGRAGQRTEALRLAAELHSLAAQKYVPAYQFAIAYAGLGDADQVMRWLEKAYQERSDYLVSLRVEPIFDPLRTNPHFLDLERRVGLQP